MKRQAIGHHAGVTIDFVDGGLQQPNCAHRYIKLFRHQHRQGRAHALPHFTFGDHDTDDAIGANRDPTIEGTAALAQRQCRTAV